jgi:cyanate permease
VRRRVFLGGQAVSMLGDGLALLAIPLLVLRVTSSPEAAVLASLPGSVGYLAAGIPAGVVVDRLDPWLVLAGGTIEAANAPPRGAVLTIRLPPGPPSN